jgi:hypothetical protein
MAQRLMWILWPGFVVAIPAVGIVFTVVDPADLHAFGEPFAPQPPRRLHARIPFFWALGADAARSRACCKRSPFELNRCPLAPQARPGAARSETGRKDAAEASAGPGILRVALSHADRKARHESNVNSSPLSRSRPLPLVASPSRPLSWKCGARPRAGAAASG